MENILKYNDENFSKLVLCVYNKNFLLFYYNYMVDFETNKTKIKLVEIYN